MKVVIDKATNKLVYRSVPEFEEGMGIKNAVSLTGLPEKTFAEVDMDLPEWEVQVEASATTDYKALYAKAKDDSERLSIIAQKLKLI